MSKNTWYTIARLAATANAARAASGGDEKNADEAASRAEILIYGDIGASWWDDESITAKAFVAELEALDVDHITLRINSYGGSVADGLAIHNALRRHRAQITVEIDGVAFSIASLIAMAGDEIRMSANALLMIHAPWVSCVSGNAQELRRQADQLDKWALAMRSCYSRVTGNDTQAKNWLESGEDHFFTATEALAERLIQAISDTPDQPHALSRAAIQARFHPAPAAAAPSSSLPPVNAMPQKTTQAAPAPAAAAPAAAPAAPKPEDILAQDSARRQAIRAAFAPFASHAGVPDLQRQCEDKHDCTPQAASERLLALLAAASTPTAGITTVEDESDKHRAAAQNALLARAGLDKPDSANPLRGHTLAELARASLDRAGIASQGMNRLDLVGRALAHSSSDFPELLGGVARKALLKGYEEANETFHLWTRTGTLSDFRPARRVDLNTFGSLPLLPEGAEYTYGTVGERGETVVLATYGKKFAITRQAIINDDLDVFTRIPRLMGRAAIRTVGDLVYAVLTRNAALRDGIALFHADHANLLTASAITTASVDAMQSAMALQALDGHPLNIALKYLIVPVSLKGAANLVLKSEYEVGGSDKRSNTVPNIVRDGFEVIADARLDAHDKKAWYGAASGQLHDTIEVSYLDGNQTPYLEQQNAWNVDGAEFKVRIDAGVAPLDFRTLAKNPGA